MTEAQLKRKAKEIHTIYTGTFGTELGQKCLDHLTKTFIDRPIYIQGNSIEQTAYRQGQADLVKQILKEIKGQ